MCEICVYIRLVVIELKIIHLSGLKLWYIKLSKKISLLKCIYFSFVLKFFLYVKIFEISLYYSKKVGFLTDKCYNTIKSKCYHHLIDISFFFYYH